MAKENKEREKRWESCDGGLVIKKPDKKEKPKKTTKNK